MQRDVFIVSIKQIFDIFKILPASSWMERAQLCCLIVMWDQVHAALHAWETVWLPLRALSVERVDIE